MQNAVSTSSTIIAGTYSFCYACDILPVGATVPVVFTKEIVLEVAAAPIDCSNSLIDASFVNPASINYKSGGSSITIVNSYNDIFIN